MSKKDWYVCNCGKNDRFEVNFEWLIQLNVSRWQPLFYKIQIKSKVETFLYPKIKMNFLNFVIFASLLSMNVKSLGFNLYWDDLLRSKRTDSNTNKGYIGMTYSMLPNGVRQNDTWIRGPKSWSAPTKRSVPVREIYPGWTFKLHKLT